MIELEKPSITVHIGLHKTGSTYLQKSLFPYMKGITFIHWDTFGEAFRKCFYCPGDLFEENKTALLRQLEPVIHSENVLISAEAFSGFAWDSFQNREIPANRLLALFDIKRVLLVIRRQDDLIRSMYWQYITLEDLNVSMNDYVNVDDPIPSRAPHINVEWLNYYSLFRFYETLFGKSNVKVLLYEDLKYDPDKFLRLLCEYAEGYIDTSNISGKPVYVSGRRFDKIDFIRAATDKIFGLTSVYRTGFWGRANRILDRLDRKLPKAFLRDGKHALNDKLRERILAKVSEGNEMLDSCLRLGMDQYGYY